LSRCWIAASGVVVVWRVEFPNLVGNSWPLLRYGGLKLQKRSFYVARLHIVDVYRRFGLQSARLWHKLHYPRLWIMPSLFCSCTFRIRRRAKCSFLLILLIICWFGIWLMAVVTCTRLSWKLWPDRISATVPDRVMVDTPKWPQYPTLYLCSIHISGLNAIVLTLLAKTYFLDFRTFCKIEKMLNI